MVKSQKNNHTPLEMNKSGEGAQKIIDRSNQEQVEGQNPEELYHNPTVEDIAAQLGEFEYGAPNNEDGDLGTNNTL